MKRITLLVFFVLALVTLALANTQGPFGSNTGTSPGGWTSPSSTAANEGIYATKNITSTSDSGILDTNTLQFTIPTGATINGIQVSVTGHCSIGGKCDLGDTNALGNIGIQLTKSVGVGTGTGKTDTTTWNSTDLTFSYGSVSDLWGTTWSVADINSSGFGVNINVENTDTITRTASVDSILVTVTFTPAPSSSGFLKMFSLLRPHTMSQTRSIHSGN